MYTCYRLCIFMIRGYRENWDAVSDKCLPGSHKPTIKNPCPRHGHGYSVQRKKLGAAPDSFHTYQRSLRYRCEDINHLRLRPNIYRVGVTEPYWRDIRHGSALGSAIIIKEGERKEKRLPCWQRPDVHFQRSQAHCGASRCPCQRVGTCHT
jgi:hypothetical protein